MNKGHDKGQMSDREAMWLALEALERSMEAGMTGMKIDQAITALHQALKQPEQPQFFYGQDPNVLPASDKGEGRE